MDPDFYMFTLDEYEVLEPTMLQKIKKFSNRPDPGAMDSFTASVLSKVLDSKLSYTALDLTDQQRAVLENFTDKIRGSWRRCSCIKISYGKRVRIR